MFVFRKVFIHEIKKGTVFSFIFFSSRGWRVELVEIVEIIGKIKMK